MKAFTNVTRFITHEFLPQIAYMYIYLETHWAHDIVLGTMEVASKFIFCFYFLKFICVCVWHQNLKG